LKKTTILFLIALISNILFSGCYDRIEIDDQAYVMAIGLDKGKTNFLRMTLQIAVPSASGKSSLGSEEENGEGEGPKSVTTTTVETPAIYSGFNMVNTYISKRLNFSHTKALIFSSELAKEGISEYINAFYRGREFRNTMFIGVSTDSAEDYIRKINYVLDVNPSKFYEETFYSYLYTSFNANTHFFNFYSQAKCSCSSPVATLVGVDKIGSLNAYSIEYSTFMEKERENYLEGDFTAGNIPKEYKNKTSMMGLAVFNGAKMVGELDGQETRYHLMLTGEYNYSYLTVPDPESEGSFILLNVKQSRPPRHSVKMMGDTPIINARIFLEADILSIQSGINYEHASKMHKLEISTEEFLEKDMMMLLQKISKDYRVDIVGFGKKIKGKFMTLDKWTEFDWKKKYPNADFDLVVDLKIRRPGLIIKTSPYES